MPIINKERWMFVPNWLCQKLGCYVQSKFNPNKQAGVLYFHRVLTEPDPFYPDDITTAELKSLLLCLKAMFDIVPVDQIDTLPLKESRPKLAITLDDGYRDNLTNGLPVFEELDVPVTIFIATAGIEEGILWQDRVVEVLRKADASTLTKWSGTVLASTAARVELGGHLLRDWKYATVEKRDANVASLMKQAGLCEGDMPRLMLTKGEIVELASHPLVSIGAHTHNHAILTSVTAPEASIEIKQSIKILSEITKREIAIFCYPNGALGKDYLPEHADIVSASGCVMSFNTMDGGVPVGVDKLNISRFLPYRKNPILRSLAAMKIAGELA
jgi:peptidoglycan/xylan/chitin deacetylase (PgdA/CDA1 family)